MGASQLLQARITLLPGRGVQRGNPPAFVRASQTNTSSGPAASLRKLEVKRKAFQRRNWEARMGHGQRGSQANPSAAPRNYR